MLRAMSEKVRVLAAVICRNHQYLLALRPAGKRHAGYWEFPGGKVEPDEHDVDAISRELREELGVTLHTLGSERGCFRDGESQFEITFVDVTIDGEPMALEHAALAWVAAHEFDQYKLAPSDLACARIIAEAHARLT